MATGHSSEAVTSDDQLLAGRKKAARKAASALRKAFHVEHGVQASKALVNRVTDALDPGEGTVISGFLPIGSEIDLHPLMDQLGKIGCSVVLPCVVAPETPLVFRHWRVGDPLVSESFGTRAPSPEAQEAEPDILLVPMLAFDRRGYRLGYGGGFYDRSLEALRGHKPVLAVGVAYSAQECDAVPIGAYDQPLDWIITEAEAFQPCA